MNEGEKYLSFILCRNSTTLCNKLVLNSLRSTRETLTFRVSYQLTHEGCISAYEYTKTKCVSERFGCKGTREFRGQFLPGCDGIEKRVCGAI